MIEPLKSTVEEARSRIKEHFRRRSSEAARSIVEGWKAERTYPFPDVPRTALEEVKREVFDILAVTASEHLPDFAEAPAKTRAFQLQMLRQAVESSPEDLQLIFLKVLDLPPRKQEELAAMLRETSLPAIISAAKAVSDRLKVITSIDGILFSTDIMKHLRERTQLHRILADNCWIFGEQFNLMASDRGLTECLRQHAKAQGREIVIDRPVRHPTKSRGIVDLMLAKQRRLHRETDLEHLIVELKAPTVTIGRAEIKQLEEYAEAITSDGRFDLTATRWVFWAISNNIDDGALRLRQLRGAPEGVIIDQDNLTMIVRTWGQVLNENKARLQFFQEKFELSVTKSAALRHLRKRYDAMLAGTLSDEILESTESEEAVEDSP